MGEPELPGWFCFVSPSVALLLRSAAHIDAWSRVLPSHGCRVAWRLQEALRCAGGGLQPRLLRGTLSCG